MGQAGKVGLKAKREKEQKASLNTLFPMLKLSFSLFPPEHSG